MQDISRDDFSILNGPDVTGHPTDKDICPTLIYRIQNASPLNSAATILPKQFNNEENAVQSYAPVKLEDINTIDLFPSHSNWQQHPINESHDLSHHQMYTNSHNRFDHTNTKLLLQGSEDPLISHGANNVLSQDDEHPADFAKSLITKANLQNNINKQDNQEGFSKLLMQSNVTQRVVKSGCSNLTKQQLKVKANLMSARNQQQQNQHNLSANISTTTSLTNQKHLRTQKTKNKKGSQVKLRFHHQALPPEYLSHYEATQGQQRKNLPKANTTNQRTSKPSQTRSSHENVRSWLQKIAEIQRTANASKDIAQKPTERQQSQSKTDKISESNRSDDQISTDANNNSQSQYVHELQNTSNYKQVTTKETNIIADMNNRPNSKRSHYSDLPYMGEITLDNCKPRRGRKPKKADICHLIYKNYGTVLPKKNKNDQSSTYTHGIFNVENNGLKNEVYEQPLNLCLRDQLNDSYSISSGDDQSETSSSCPTPISTPLDYVRDSMLANNLKNSLNNINEQKNDDISPKTSNKSRLSSTGEKVLHPITMYYQKLLESGVLLQNSKGPYKTIQKDNQLAIKIPIPNGLLLSHKLDKTTTSSVTSNIEYPEPLSTPSSIKSENSLATSISSTTNQPQVAPQKRKRSAIFIPPMNVENTTNPATEVSICKFKFTGGSKPMLQEKKMVSVDAGGNYRYFSGTGDKASRGYEYFPRESLQHTAGLLPGVNCTGQKVSFDVMGFPESSATSSVLSGGAISGSTMTDTISSKSSTSYEVSKNVACSNSITENSSYSSSSQTILPTNRCAVQRKKNVIQQQIQKSSQKEKLEKTFKEQGFLIKTQQLESAEGATYCKFRQLKKFTRYLFRNWKDYLPDTLQENTNAAALISVADISSLTDENGDNKEA